MGDRLPHRPLVDRHARVRPGGSPRAPSRRDRFARPVLRRAHLAVHAGLGADRVCRGRRRAHCGPDRSLQAGRKRTCRAGGGSGLTRREQEESRMNSKAENFPTATGGLPEAHEPELVELSDGDHFELRIAPVAKRIGDSVVRMLAYNGSIPGPVLKLPEGSQVDVDIVNEGDMEATVHWHGLRLENRYDGTHETQAAIPVGGRFTARVEFPDPGVYWYHPHIREDYGQEMGLYGNILVEPAAADYWPPVDRELALTLDDILLEDGKVAPFDRAETTYAAMGRFGNVLLTRGESDLSLTAQGGEVVRLHLTNTANTRVFKVALPGARMKLVGGDSGHVEQEQLVDEVVLAPSERAVVHVLFEETGSLTLEHRTPEKTYALAGGEGGGNGCA